MFENTPSDRVQLVGLGELLSPAVCMICRNGNCEEGYARLGVWYDYEGEQYICRTCTVQVAELFGCLVPEEAKHLQEQATLLAADNATLKTDLEDTRERLSAVDNLILNAVAAGTVSVSDASAKSSISAADSGTSVTVDEQVISESDGAESVAYESVTSVEPAGTAQSELRDDTPERVIPKL